MPRLRRRKKRRIADWDLTGTLADIEARDGRIQYLTHGFSFVSREAFDDDETAHAAWVEIRSLLLAKFINEMPGTRPWAFWEYDAPERRRCHGKHPFDDPARKRDMEKWRQEYPDVHRPEMDLYFGIPQMISSRAESELEFETEGEFLIRLNLLTDFEREVGPENFAEGT